MKIELDEYIEPELGLGNKRQNKSDMYINHKLMYILQMKDSLIITSFFIKFHMQYFLFRFSTLKRKRVSFYINCIHTF